MLALVRVALHLFKLRGMKRQLLLQLLLKAQMLQQFDLDVVQAQIARLLLLLLSHLRLNLLMLLMLLLLEL